MNGPQLPQTSDVNKATSHKAKARELKCKDFQHSPRPGQGQTRPRPGQGHSRHTATVLDQNKTSDIIYLLQSVAINDKNKIPFITSASILWFIARIIFFSNYKFRMSSPLGLTKITTITSFSFSSVQLKFQLQVMLLHSMRQTY